MGGSTVLPLGYLSVLLCAHTNSITGQALAEPNGGAEVEEPLKVRFVKEGVHIVLTACLLQNTSQDKGI